MRDFYDTRWRRVEEDRERSIFTLDRPRSQIEFAYQQKNAFVERVLERHFGRLGGLSVLETGCGRGTTSLYLARRRGASCTLLDFSHPAILLAQRNFRAEGCRGQFLQSDVLHLPFRNAMFDAVMSVGLLEHFLDVAEPMREMARVIRPGGLFVSYNAPSVRPGSLDRVSRAYGVVAGRVRRVHGAISTFRLEKLRKLPRYLLGQPNGPPPPPADRYRNDYGPLQYKAEAERAGLAAVQVMAVEPFVMFRPVPRRVDAFLARLFKVLLEVRRRTGWSDPYTTRLDAGRGHFVWGVKE